MRGQSFLSTCTTLGIRFWYLRCQEKKPLSFSYPKFPLNLYTVAADDQGNHQQPVMLCAPQRTGLDVGKLETCQTFLFTPHAGGLRATQCLKTPQNSPQ